MGIFNYVKVKKVLRCPKCKAKMESGDWQSKFLVLKGKYEPESVGMESYPLSKIKLGEMHTICEGKTGHYLEFHISNGKVVGWNRR